MLFALVVFVLNCNYIGSSINSLINNFCSSFPPGTQTQGSIDNDIYVEKLIDYATRIQELGANSISTNVLTFLYTFLSGTLIGVATYFTKKSFDSVKQIKENRDKLADLNGRTLYSSLLLYTQSALSTVQVFSVSLDAIQDAKVLDSFIQRSVPRLNEAINKMNTFFSKQENELRILTGNEKNQLITEINEIGGLIYLINIPENDLIVKEATIVWKKQLDEIKNIISNKRSVRQD